MGGVGLYGRPPFLPLPPDSVIGQGDVADAGHTVPQTASIKALPAPLHRPRPYGGTT